MRVNWRIVGITVGVVVGFWIINRLSNRVVSSSVHHSYEQTTVKYKQDNNFGKILNCFTNSVTWTLQAIIILNYFKLFNVTYYRNLQMLRYALTPSEGAIRFLPVPGTNAAAGEI